MTSSSPTGESSRAARPRVQYAYRTVKELGVGYGPPTNKLAEGFEKQTGNIRTFVYSKDGRFLAWATPDCVKVLNAETMEPVTEIVRANVLDMEFSPRGTYLSTWERYVKPSDDTVNQNTNIWETASATRVTGFTQKSHDNWNVQWSMDEEFCAQLAANAVHLYNVKNLSKGTHTTLRLEGISAFSMSPGKSPALAVFLRERNGGPASVRIFSLTNFAQPVSSKTFFKADKAQMYWDDLGTHVLVLTQTDVDKTGKSYYGETNLYYLSANGTYDCRVMLDKEGPVQDVAWSPNSKEFIVIYGFMPAKATLFDHRANPIYNFGVGPRNYVRFSPHGRLVCLAGFGNLAGTMDIWDITDRAKVTKLATMEASGSSVCDWSPDGRHIMTATLSPRLRVDNGFKVWHHRGVLVHQEEIDELLQIGWRPASVKLYPMRGALSPAPKGIAVATTKAAAPKPTGAYRPPGARGTSTPNIFKRDDERPGRVNQYTVPGAPAKTTDAQLSKSSLKNKKKREKKKTAEDNVPAAAPASSSKVNGSKTNGKAPAGVAASSIAVEAPAAPRKPMTETEKKIKAVNRKLKQIEELKERLDKGDKLELTQMQKIETESALRKELASLQ
ncbi:eukaryotic translation initiation factor eIF2A-domain-containing protein [Thamnocephalis sphaerospora]|uniref:Eukaryotic translation initiation factor 2A n=1 Tax=Thamnocephalis sphaerospora TaxID=78915 RepID=A0A4P9XL98_9FUNG|nr:eukaryotic translation initiation factor eIF2A-domain-containing protein [Thamnocephalis sphaerospora]|eukprot:RKP06566.1 eukaryotic translation initiation factor eIF2A-domain-containing protein [Thamnocephalis sphaerospora]